MSGPLPGAAPVPDLDAHRALARRARQGAWHWAFRAVLLGLISGLALKAGWYLFGILFGLLALMSVGLSRSMRRRAAQLAAQIKLLEAGR